MIRRFIVRIIKVFVFLCLMLVFSVVSLFQIPTFAQDEPTDSINQTINGVRQGLWKIKNKNGKTDEGSYVDGKKHGEWKTMTADGICKSSVTFNMGVAEGLAIYYFPDGTIMEKGYWKIDHWEGEYERYYQNGNKSCTFTYGNDGKRVGKQTYYHENGNKMFEGEWANGKIAGTLTIFNEQGTKVMERNYDSSGKFQGSQAVDVPPVTEKRDVAEFKGSGNYTFFDSAGRMSQKGEYRDGVLYNGERYTYNAKGKLEKTEIWRNGKLQSVRQGK